MSLWFDNITWKRGAKVRLFRGTAKFFPQKVIFIKKAGKNDNNLLIIKDECGILNLF
jgi:hypothetical protein